MDLYEYMNRTLCDVLEDMRTCFKTYNFAPMLALIEEAQMMGNKMGAGLNDKHDVEKMKNRKKELVKEIRLLKEQRKALKPEDE